MCKSECYALSDSKDGGNIEHPRSAVSTDRVDVFGSKEVQC